MSGRRHPAASYCAGSYALALSYPEQYESSWMRLAPGWAFCRRCGHYQRTYDDRLMAHYPRMRRQTRGVRHD